jgi:hypothetical protein
VLDQRRGARRLAKDAVETIGERPVESAYLLQTRAIERRAQFFQDGVDNRLGHQIRYHDRAVAPHRLDDIIDGRARRETL